MSTRNATQESILAAWTDLIEEIGSDDVSFKVLARRAGVGERTIFRNYSTRVDLLLAAAERAEETVFARRRPTSVFDVPLLVRETMEACRRRPELAHLVAETAVRAAAAGGGQASSRAGELLELCAAELPAVPLEERTTMVAALCHIDSPAMWVLLTRDLAMDPVGAADAAAWAAEAVLDPVRTAVG